MRGRCERIERARPVAGGSECKASPLLERRIRFAGRSRVLERLQIVVCEYLGVLLLAAERGHPLCSGAMLLGPRGPRDLAVGDVADEQVEERVLALALDRRPSLATEEVLARERVQALLDRGPITTVHLRDGSRPEDLAEDCGILE